MPMDVTTAAEEEVGVSMEQKAANEMEEREDEVEENTAEEVVEEAAAHMKMGLTSQTSTVNLNMYNGTHSQMRQEKG